MTCKPMVSLMSCEVFLKLELGLMHAFSSAFTAACCWLCQPSSISALLAPTSFQHPISDLYALFKISAIPHLLPHVKCKNVPDSCHPFTSCSMHLTVCVETLCSAALHQKLFKPSQLSVKPCTRYGAGTTTEGNGSSTYSYVPSPEGTYQPWWDMWYRYMQTAILSK